MATLEGEVVDLDGAAKEYQEAIDEYIVAHQAYEDSKKALDSARIIAESKFGVVLSYGDRVQRIALAGRKLPPGFY